MGDFAKEIDEMLDGYIPPQEDESDESDLNDETNESKETDDSEEEDEGSEEVEEDEEETEEEDNEEEESDDVDEESEDSDDEEGKTESEEDEEEGVIPTEALVSQINELSTGMLNIDDDIGGEPIEEGKRKPDKTEDADSGKSDDTGDPADPLASFDFDEVVSKPEVFTKVLQETGNLVRQQVNQQVLQNIVPVIAQQVQQQLQLQEMTRRFFEENEDLEAVRPYVAAVASAVQTKKPDMTLDKVFEKTAEITRKKLGLKGGVKSKKKPAAKKKPALVNKGSKARSGTKTKKTQSKIEKEISELIDL